MKFTLYIFAIIFFLTIYTRKNFHIIIGQITQKKKPQR